MDALFITIAFIFVLGVLALVGYAIFEVSPFARHADHYRDPVTAKRRFKSPRLD